MTGYNPRRNFPNQIIRWVSDYLSRRRFSYFSFFCWCFFGWCFFGQLHGKNVPLRQFRILRNVNATLNFARGGETDSVLGFLVLDEINRHVNTFQNYTNSRCHALRCDWRVLLRFGRLSWTPVPVMWDWCPIATLPTLITIVLLSCFRITTGCDFFLLILPLYSIYRQCQGVNFNFSWIFNKIRRRLTAWLTTLWGDLLLD